MIIKEWISIITKAGIIQFLKFTVVGTSNSLVYLGVYYLFTWVSDSTTAAMIGQAVAWITSVTNSFIWNRRYVFKGVGRPWWVLLIKVYMGYGFGLGVSSGLTYLQVEILSVPRTIVPIVNLLAMGPVNFFIIKYFAFGRKRAIRDAQG